MPTSREGLEYEHLLFKPLPLEGGGCHADVFIPTTGNGPFPIAISYHGGGFTVAGAQHIFTGHTAYLLERGFCLVSLEYRLAPHVRFDKIREDLIDGYVWVLNVLPTLKNVDPSRVFVMGGSAGGTSTLIVTIEAKKRGLPLPKALYPAYPLVDLTVPIAGRTEYMPYEKALAAASPAERAIFDKLFAEPGATTHDILAEDESNLTPRSVWASFAIGTSSLSDYLGMQGKPSLHETITSDWPPTVVLSAGADALLDPKEHAEVLFAKLQEAGVESKFLDCKGMEHGAIEPKPDGKMHAWWAECKEALDFCIGKCK